MKKEDGPSSQGMKFKKGQKVYVRELHLTHKTASKGLLGKRDYSKYNRAIIEGYYTKVHNNYRVNFIDIPNNGKTIDVYNASHILSTVEYFDLQLKKATQ